MKTKFWILWNPEGSRPPTVRFSSLEGARKEAVRMQAAIGVGTMYVMESVAGVTVSLLQSWDKSLEKKK